MAAQHAINVITSVQAILGHQFNDPSLVTEALQAAGSLVRFAGSRSIPDGNKRLALLGDSVLKLAILDHWYEGGSPRGSGDQTVQSQANNVNLAMIGNQSGIAPLVNTNPSQPGIVTDKIMAATVEALLGAVYLDAAKDIEAVKTVMRALGLGTV